MLAVETVIIAVNPDDGGDHAGLVRHDDVYFTRKDYVGDCPIRSAGNFPLGDAGI